MAAVLSHAATAAAAAGTQPPLLPDVVKHVVFGEDEWLGVLRDESTKPSDTEFVVTKLNVAGTDFHVRGRRSISRPSYTHEKNTLFVHRWPEFEFIPPPYGLATPMFWHDPTK